MRMAAKLVFCVCLILAILSPSLAAAGNYTVAVLKDKANDKTQAIADSLMPALTRNGFTAEFITYETICSKDGLNKYGCLVLTDSVRFPAEGRENLKSFLKRGSDLILLGGLAFKEDIWQIGNGWGTAQQRMANSKSPDKVVSRKMLFDFEDGKWEGWRRGATKKENPTILLSDKGVDGNCMKMDIKNISDYEWDNFRYIVADKIPANHNAIVFYARATGQTKYLIFEIIEKDGSRWISPVEISQEWREYILTPEDLKFFGEDSEGKQKDDKLNLADANMISLGLAYGIMPHISGDHTIWIDRIATGVLKLPDSPDKVVKSSRLPVFEDRDIYYFQNAPGIVTYDKQDILKSKVKLAGNWTGISAVAFEYPEISRFIPLLTVQDKYSRNSGLACGMLVNYAGEFKNSHWLLFGIDSSNFYCSKEFLDITVELLNRIKQKDLPAKLAAEDTANKQKCLTIVSPAPKDYIKLSKDKKHFILPDGRKFFALGCNYIGPFERKCEYGEDYFNSKRLEDDFKKAKDAGINAFRFWDFRIEEYPERLKTVIELARKYQIYLILQPRDHPLPTDKAMADVYRKTAAIAGGQTIVLGYDLMNEPYVTTVGSVSIKGEPSEILKLKTYEKYSAKYFDKKWVDDTIKTPTGWPELGNWIKGDDAKNLYAAFSMSKQYIEKFNPPADYSCLYGLDGRLPVEPDYKEFISALDKTFADWILFQKEIINQSDSNHFITVGYNSSLAALPTNSLLDFTSHHIYQKPYSYQDIQKSVTTFDRLRAFWPDKPITVGEFGFSSGLEMPNGAYLGRYAASVAEMMVYLYAFANDYSGAYLWMLSEWPLANMRYNVWWIPQDKQIYESRFGMYYYDGTPQGSPKPIAHATKFFREYIDTHNPGDGNLVIVQADTPMSAGFVFSDKDALFVGNTKYESERLNFQSSVPVNVMLLWNSKQLKIMATADVEISINPQGFGFPQTADFGIDGQYDSLLKKDGTFKLKLLEGQTVTFICKKG